MHRYTFLVNGRTYVVRAASYEGAQSKLADLLNHHPRYP